MPTRECKPLILIVDDSEDDVMILRRRLKEAEIDARQLIYHDSADALAFLREIESSPEGRFLCPEIMFLDLQMPKVHGFVFLKWVRSQAWLDDMRLFVLSGSDRSEDRERSLKLGADRYLVKFPKAEEFAELLAACMA
jgi:DNA-binding response OmpR family regulator